MYRPVEAAAKARVGWHLIAEAVLIWPVFMGGDPAGHAGSDRFLQPLEMTRSEGGSRVRQATCDRALLALAVLPPERIGCGSRRLSGTN